LENIWPGYIEYITGHSTHLHNARLLASQYSVKSKESQKSKKSCFYCTFKSNR